MPKFNKSKGFKLKSGNNPFQKNFSSPNKQRVTGGARPEVQTQTDILLSALEGYGGGEGSENAGLYDDLARTAGYRESSKEKEIDAILADKYGFTGGQTVQDAHEDADYLRALAEGKAGEVSEEEAKDLRQEAGKVLHTAKDREARRLASEREKEDLLAEYAGEGGGMGEAINEMIMDQKIAQKRYDKDKEKAEDALVRAEEAAENRGFFEFGKKKRDEEKIAAAEEAVSAFEKSSGFKMKGSYHYGKKKKV